MKYVVKEPPKLNVVADADALMREFNRAMGVVYNDVDQNNVSDNKIKWPLIAHPVTQWGSSTSIVGYSIRVIGTAAASFLPQAILQSDDQTLDAPGPSDEGDYEERSENKFWQYIERSSGVKLSLDTLNPSEAAELTVIANGQIRVADEDSTVDGAFRTSIYDIRILDGGQPLDPVCTVSVETNHGYVPFHVSVRKLFMAGDHNFRVQIRDRSNGVAASEVSDTVICGFGFVR